MNFERQQKWIYNFKAFAFDLLKSAHMAYVQTTRVYGEGKDMRMCMYTCFILTLLVSYLCTMIQRDFSHGTESGEIQSMSFGDIRIYQNC